MGEWGPDRDHGMRSRCCGGAFRGRDQTSDQLQLIDGFHWLKTPLGFVSQTQTCLS